MATALRRAYGRHLMKKKAVVIADVVAESDYRIHPHTAQPLHLHVLLAISAPACA